MRDDVPPVGVCSQAHCWLSRPGRPVSPWPVSLCRGLEGPKPARVGQRPMRATDAPMPPRAVFAPASKLWRRGVSKFET